jgi:hypothetical protein
MKSYISARIWERDGCLDTPGLCKRPVMQMLKATNTNTCKHAMERVALWRGLISARTGEERAAAAAAAAATATREIQICQLGHLHAIRGENRLLRGICEAERK